METVTVFSEAFQKLLSTDILHVQLEPAQNNDSPSTSRVRSNKETNSTSLSCSYCRSQFTDLQSQRDHFKLDWHRYNLKQSLVAKAPLTEEEFNVKNDNDDVSSISGSDSEKEDTLDTYATAQGKIFLSTSDQTVFSVYRCLLCDRKEELDGATLSSRLNQVSTINNQWTVLMLGGGHFAGGVFKGSEPILHKTFHCYTVRAGQGGAQSSKDNKTGAGSHPKSAGASLRRYNEQALTQHVRSIIETWQQEIEKSSLIIYRASGPYNRSVLFGGQDPPLDRSDNKLRTIPFSTRRATYAELKRVHALLSSAKIYESLEKATENFSKQKAPEIESRKNKQRSSCINRAKSREIIERPLPVERVSTSSESADINLVIADMEMSLNELKVFDDSLTKEERKKGRIRTKKNTKNHKIKEKEQLRRTELIDIISKGNLNHLIEIAKDSPDNSFFNQIVDEDGNTLLHYAAKIEQKEILIFLLENDASPTARNKQQETVYTCTQSKEMREILRQFARDNPDKYNYNKAQIPINALTPEELADKKRVQRKVKREKDKVKKKENDIKRKEQEEQDRFLQLSDREKRALAAERRIRDQNGKVIVRCFRCASNITGMVPFEYDNNVFCSIACLKIHRSQHQ